MNRNETLIAILKDQVVPALGCTEPGAVVHASCPCQRAAGHQGRFHGGVWDKNVLKNGLGVGIPGTPSAALCSPALWL